MIEIIKELNIEVSKPNVFQAVVAKQYDMNTRFIKATLVDNGEKIYVDHTATLQVIINALRLDGESKGFDGVINDDGTVTVPLHSWMLELEGTVICDISIIDTATDNNKKLTTTSFTLIVERAAWGSDGMTNDPQYNLLIELLNSCSEAGAVADEALQKSNEAIERAEGVRGIYVGSGDMPDECDIQIDPEGDACIIDKELNPDSESPIANKVVTQEFERINDTLSRHEESFAPSGYGLGKVWPEKKVYTPADMDTLKKTGWYFADFIDYNNAPDTKVDLGGVGFNYATVQVVAIDQDTFYQIVYPHPNTCQSKVWRYHTGTQGFFEWEVENPPMEAGKEYRTTERNNGKPVYVQLVVISPLPSAASSVYQFGSQVTKIVSYDGVWQNGAGATWHIGSPLRNFVIGADVEYELSVSACGNKGELEITSSGATDYIAKGHSAEVIVKYTK